MNWIEAQQNALARLIKPDWHFADIGACVGKMSDFLIPQMERGHIFEPSPRNYAYLTQKYDKLKEGNVIINECAVSRYNGVANFSINTEDTHTGNLEGVLPDSHPKNYKEQLTTVKTVNLDTYFKDKKIDLIKIDTEGSEWDILEGATQIMTTNSIIFQIEFHWDEDWGRRTMLDELGYKIYDLNFKLLERVDPRPYQGIVSNHDF